MIQYKAKEQNADLRDKYLNELLAFASSHLVCIDESDCDKRSVFWPLVWLVTCLDMDGMIAERTIVVQQYYTTFEVVAYQGSDFRWLSWFTRSRELVGLGF